MRHFFLFACTLLLLTACGTRSALTMPPSSSDQGNHSSKLAEATQ